MSTKSWMRNLNCASTRYFMANKPHFINAIMLVILIGFFFAPTNVAQAWSTNEITITFTKIADFDTPIPGENGKFTSFQAASIKNGTIAFIADYCCKSNDTATEALYTVRVGHTPRLVVDTTMQIPGGVENFHAIGHFPSNDGASVAFADGPMSTSGLYLGRAGHPTTLVADRNTPVPGKSGATFSYFSGKTSNSLEDGIVAFHSTYLQNGSYGDGMYAFTQNGTIIVLADQNTPIPGGIGMFAFFGGDASMSKRNVVFIGYDMDYQTGIYVRRIGGSLRVVADKQTPIPGDIGNFKWFLSPAISGNKIAFIGQGEDGRQGIYVTEGYRGRVQVIADSHTPIPDGFGNFVGGLYSPSISGDNILFMFTPSGGDPKAVYLSRDGRLMKVIDTSDTLDGKAIKNMQFIYQALDGDDALLIIDFENGEAGIYLAKVGQRIPKDNTHRVE